MVKSQRTGGWTYTNLVAAEKPLFCSTHTTGILQARWARPSMSGRQEGQWHDKA